MIVKHESSTKFRNNYNGDKLNSLMLIIDEVGYDLEFTRALIFISRTLKDLDVLGKVANRVRLVLCGTGLDFIEKDQSTSLASRI